MIEAVNSVLQTASFVRTSSEQTSNAESFAANPDRVQKVPQAPFVSPYIFVDVHLNKAVLQVRNGETGDVEGQLSNQAVIDAQIRQADVASAESLQPRQQQQESVAPTPQQAPRQQSGADVSVQQTLDSPPPADSGGSNAASISVQQQAAFHAAAQSGNSNAGNITLLA